MTDTVTGLLTPALCELADLQHGMLTRDQAVDAGDPGLPAALVAAGLAETITDTVVRLKAGAHHPHPRIYAAWLGIAPHGSNRDRDLECAGIASHSTALALCGLIPHYGPVYEFTVHDEYWWEEPIAYAGEDEENAGDDGDADQRQDGARANLWFHRAPRVPHWTVADDIPVTMPAQTLFDLADRLDANQLNALAHQFVERHHLDPDDLRNDLIGLCEDNDKANAAAEAERQDRQDNFEDDWRPWIVPPRSEEWAQKVTSHPDGAPF